MEDSIPMIVTQSPIPILKAVVVVVARCLCCGTAPETMIN